MGRRRGNSINKLYSIFHQENRLKKVILPEILLLLLLGVVLFFLLRGTAGIDVPLTDIDVLLTKTELNGMEKGDALLLKRAFGLNAKDYTEVLYYAPDNTMSVNEIVLIRFANASQKAEITEAFRMRLDTQKKNFDGYGTDQTYLLNHAISETGENFALFLVGTDAQTYREIIRKVREE